MSAFHFCGRNNTVQILKVLLKWVLVLRMSNKSNSFQSDLRYFQKGPVPYKSWLHPQTWFSSFLESVSAPYPARRTKFVLRMSNKSNSFESDVLYFQKGPFRTNADYIWIVISRELANLKYISNICSLFLFTIRTDKVDRHHSVYYL